MQCRLLEETHTHDSKVSVSSQVVTFQVTNSGITLKNLFHFHTGSGQQQRHDHRLSGCVPEINFPPWTKEQ